MPDTTLLELRDDAGVVIATLELHWTRRRQLARGGEQAAEDVYEGTLRPLPGWVSSAACRQLAAAWEAANDGAFAVHEQLQDQLRAQLSLRVVGDGRALEFTTLDVDEDSVVLVLPAAPAE